MRVTSLIYYKDINLGYNIVIGQVCCGICQKRLVLWHFQPSVSKGGQNSIKKF